MASFVNRVRSFFDHDKVRYRPLVDDNESGRQPGSRREGRNGGLPQDARHDEHPVGGVWARGNRPLLKLSTVIVGLAMVMYLGVAFSRVAASRGSGPSCDTPSHGYQCYPSVARQWGQYAPFFSVPSDIKAAEASPSDTESANATALPPQCRYTFALVLSRHGGRDPTAGKSAAYAELISHIQDSVDEFSNGPDGRFAFFDRYEYKMGADQLTRFGELEMVHSGAHFYQRYQSLILSGESESDPESMSTSTSASFIKPFVRAAGQHRVIMSAVNWVRGFHRARLDDMEVKAAQAAQTASRRERLAYKNNAKHAGLENDSLEDQSMVIIPEESGFNNTLSYNGLCTKFSSRNGYYAQRTFAATFVPPITERLNRGLPGANLTDRDTIALMDLCPFESISDDDGLDEGTAGRRLSPFCHLFSESEWRDYDYFQTLGKWYGFGDGSQLGAAQGIGFVNELIARLTASPVEDSTSTNHTLDSDPATFPLDAAVYADFSHDNDMANIFATMGLYNVTDGPALAPSNTTRTEPEDMLGYAASWIVPFAARMYVEKMQCDGEPEELVRVLVNDRVVPLQGCGSDALGRCTLSRYVESLAFARTGGNWDECFA